MNTEDLCNAHGITVYQVGDVYGNAPPEVLKKYFVAVTCGDFPGIAIDALPLCDTEAAAYELAAHQLLNQGTRCDEP